MVRRSRFLFFLVLFQIAGLTVIQGAAETEPSAEALEAVAARMKSLTQSLGGLPQPPSFDHKIQLPEALFPVPSTIETEEMKKENL